MKQGLREPTQRTHWPAVGLVFFAGVVAALQVGKVSIGLPVLQADLDIGLAEAGWVMALFALLGTVGGMPVGTAVSRFGDRRLLTVGLLALAVGSSVGALAGRLPLLLGARVIEGAGFLFILVAAPAVLQRIVPANHRNVAFGVWATFMPTGIAIALLAGPAIEGWRPFWMANAVLAGAVAALVRYVVPLGNPSPAPPPATGAMLDDIRAVLSAREPVLMALAFATYALQYFAVVSFLPTLLMERMQVSIATAGALAAVAVGANVLGNLAAGMLLSRGVSTGTLVLFTSVVTAFASVGIFSAVLPDALVFALCVLFSAVGGLLPASVIAGAMRSMPSLRLAPVALGLTVQGNSIGQLIGPVAVGAAVAAAGWSAAGVIVGTAGVLGAACGWGIGRQTPDKGVQARFCRTRRQARRPAFQPCLGHYPPPTWRFANVVLFVKHKTQPESAMTCAGFDADSTLLIPETRPMNLNQFTVPALDITASVDFYSRLGLALIVSSPHYARFKCPEGDSSFSIHLVHERPAPSDTVIYFEVRDLDEKVKELQRIGLAFVQEPQDEPWLWREARLSDPSGSVICLYWAGTNRLNPPWRIGPAR